MNSMFDEIVESMEALVEDGRIAKLQAKVLKQLYDNLVSEGFAAEDALELVKSHGNVFSRN